MSEKIQNDKQALIPRMRFPEFRDAGEWEAKKISETCRVTQGGTPDTKISDFWGGGVQWLTPAEMGKSDSKYITKTVRSITKNGLANCSSELLPLNSVIISTRAPIGHIAINHAPMAINQGCRGLVPNSRFDFNFIYYSLEISKSQLNDLGSGNTFKELSGNVLKGFIFGAPQLAEQQKIADCLSSLDALIAAHAEKLDVLKTHKKGLIQQLFPRKGETVPRLRFPEFRDAGEWTTKELSHLADLISEKAGKRKITLMSVTAGVGLISQIEKFGREIAGTQQKNYLVIQKNDFAYNKSATKDYPEGFIALYEGDAKGAVPNSIFTCFRVANNEIVPRFLNYQFLNNLHGRWLRKFITIGARAHGSLNIDSKDLFALPVPLPNGQSAVNEQQKIADCLSSLDALITVQAKKLDALKTHKKGLMQQLFPVINRGGS